HNFWMFFALLRNSPMDLMSFSSSESSTARKSSGVLYFLNRSRVTLLTRLSVHWAESSTAMVSSKEFSWMSSHSASGNIVSILSIISIVFLPLIKYIFPFQPGTDRHSLTGPLFFFPVVGAVQYAFIILE